MNCCAFGPFRLRTVLITKNARENANRVTNLGIFLPFWPIFLKTEHFWKNPSLEMKFMINVTIFNRAKYKNHQPSPGPCSLHLNSFWRGVIHVRLTELILNLKISQIRFLYLFTTFKLKVSNLENIQVQTWKTISQFHFDLVLDGHKKSVEVRNRVPQGL